MTFGAYFIFCRRLTLPIAVLSPYNTFPPQFPKQGVFPSSDWAHYHLLPFPAVPPPLCSMRFPQNPCNPALGRDFEETSNNDGLAAGSLWGWPGSGWAQGQQEGWGPCCDPTASALQKPPRALSFCVSPAGCWEGSAFLSNMPQCIVVSHSSSRSALWYSWWVMHRLVMEGIYSCLQKVRHE